MALFKKQPSMRLEQISTPEWHLLEGSTASGKLNIEGPARIDGHFDGEITANDSVVIGENAMVTADIKAVSIIVAGTVRGDITASERIEICSSAKVSGNLTAPQVLGQGAQNPEFAVSPKRARMRRVAVPGAAFAAIVATLLIAYPHDWRGNLADESARVVRLRSKAGRAHTARELSPLSGADFAHRETGQASVRASAPEFTVPAPSASTGGLLTFALKVPTDAASGALSGATHGHTSATTSASSAPAPSVPGSSSHLINENPHRVSDPVPPDHVVQGTGNYKAVAPGSAVLVFPSTHLEATASAAGPRTGASPLPVEPKMPRLANAEIPSPLAKQSIATAPAIAKSQQQSQRGGTVASAAVPNRQDGRMATNAGAEALAGC